LPLRNNTGLEPRPPDRHCVMNQGASGAEIQK
jgi:hypothetical protein